MLLPYFLDIFWGRFCNTDKKREEEDIVVIVIKCNIAYYYVTCHVHVCEKNTLKVSIFFFFFQVAIDAQIVCVCVNAL